MGKRKGALESCGSSQLLTGVSSLQKTASLSPAQPVLSFNDLSLPAVVLKAPDNSKPQLITYSRKA